MTDPDPEPLIPAEPPRDVHGLALKPDGTWDLDRMAEEQMLRCRRRYQPIVWALIRAGWAFEPMREDSEPYQWAWRSKPKRKGSKGRRYASTDQAYNALVKEQNGDR